MRPVARQRQRPRGAAHPLAGLLAVAVAAAVLASACAPARHTSAAASTGALPAPFLWRIEGLEATSYLFGTIHLPDERVLTLHPAVEAAFAASDAVYTEIPMTLATSMEASSRIFLEDGTRLRDVLPADLYERADRYLTARGRDIELFGRFKVWKFTMDLGMLDSFRKYLFSVPMDMTLASRAQAAGKLTGGLETVEEQMAVFESLTLEEQVEMLRQTLAELEAMEARGEPAHDEVVQLYLSGDGEALAAEMAAAEGDPVGAKFLRLILTERDERMAERAAARMRGNPRTSFFFAVGAAHCVGDEGLPVRLRRLGFQVERVHTLHQDVTAAP